MTKKLFDYTDCAHCSNVWRGKTLAVNLHSHSDKSIDGGSSPKDLLERAIELEYTHFTLSEHGNVNSAAELHRIAADANKKGKKIKIFHSVEGYIRHPKDKKSTHITIGFKTRAAYEHYCRITPILYTEHAEFKYGDAKPVMTLELFEELAQHGITVGTGCVGSLFNYPIMESGDYAESRRRLEWVINLVGKENVYDEWIVDALNKKYQPATFDKTTKRILTPAALLDNECLPWYASNDVGLACNKTRREFVTGPLGIKPIASLDSHYARKADKIVQDAKLSAGDWVMSNFQHMRSTEEYAHEAMNNQGLSEKFVEELIDNTHDYADQFSGYTFRTAKDGWLMPQYHDSNREYIWNKILELGKVDVNDPAVKERLDYEIRVLQPNAELDMLAYMRATSEIVDLAIANGILVNARGSAGGSLLAFATGISVTDPLRYELQFERFITDQRILAGVLPDVDLDFSDKDKIVSLMTTRYGDRLRPLSIDMLLKPRSAIKDSERALFGFVRPETEMLTKMMPQVPQGTDETDWLFGYEDDTGAHVPGFFEQSKELQDYAKYNPEVWDLVMRMCGVQRQKSVHACSFVITPDSAHNYFPMCRIGGKDGVLAIGYAPKDVEYVGGVKIDILGVSKMKTLEVATGLIKARHDVDLPWGEYPHDEDVYKSIYWTGDTQGTFQSSTTGICKLGIDTKPVCIEDISNLIALYRPSCLDWQIVDAAQGFKGNAVEFYVAYRQGKVTPTYIHPSMEPILKSTAGVPVFQEQVLRTFRDIGDMTYGEAEQSRRAIGKKDMVTLTVEANKLTAACLRKGWTPEQARQLFEMVIASARYGFNSAHSTSYSIVSYNTAYLKHKYPLEFWAAELSVESENEDKLRVYGEVLGDMLKQPDILRSHPTDFIIDGDKLQAPLCVIKGIGASFAHDIIKFMHTDLSDLGLELREPKEVKPKKRKVTAETKECENVLY